MNSTTPQPEQNASARQLVQLTAVQVIATLHSRRCPACGDSKIAGEAFCRTDYLALPLHLRSWTSRGPEDPHYVENYNRALNHLRLQPRRAVRILSSGIGWRYDSHESLLSAGYRLIEYERCASIRCGQRIAWYWTPNGKRIALNIPAYTPHAETCRDPEFYARRRALQASAKRKRRNA